VIESIERNGDTIYRRDVAPPVAIDSVDRAAFYQLKGMLQGVLARGTARSIAAFAPYVAGKTGTSDEENDAWFVGFSNDVTVAVWIGYDNAAGKRRTLGGGATGGAVAVPVFRSVMEAVWANIAPKTALAPPSPEAKLHLSCSEESNRGRSRKALADCLRVDAKGKVVNTQYRLISGERGYARKERKERKERNARKERAPEAPPTRSVHRYDDRGFARDPWYSGGWNWGWQNWRSPQRADPRYFWDGHRYR
jgi:membrane carboxypeptidase/penicillin-binding protein